MTTRKKRKRPVKKKPPRTITHRGVRVLIEPGYPTTPGDLRWLDAQNGKLERIPTGLALVFPNHRVAGRAFGAIFTEGAFGAWRARSKPTETIYLGPSFKIQG